ncbi:hypothetical protein L1987_50262 [Smallanthus sonchifolius]|uniref:Uncharacterized protein n=1 Tax=Smallanthus sonchifolius TaxID=185202 RepID=A0ACB9ELD5_9ASTR|nr:hypothetical protein L1987_50262 [Smallanthus sonchifolius]
MESWPFKIIQGPGEKPTVVVELKGEEKKYAPEELSAMVLKKIKECAEAFIGRERGNNGGSNHCRPQCDAVDKRASAAAIAYGLDHMDDKSWHSDRNVLVFDLGGGTFDVSLLKISKTGVIDVKAVGGDTHLGGEDFDTTLVNYCIKEFEKKHREDLRRNPRALGRLKVACEKAKRDLSSATFAPIEIDCLHEGIDFSIKIRLVEEFFDGKTLFKSMNGDEAVAFGAAILAARLSGNDDNDNVVWDVVLQDVTPLSLGIEVKIMGEKGYMHVVIPRNASIPTSKKIICPHDEACVTISVYQGESNKVNILLGRFSLYDLKLGSSGKSDIEVCFNIDANGILIVSAQEISTGQTKSITISKT